MDIRSVSSTAVSLPPERDAAVRSAKPDVKPAAVAPVAAGAGATDPLDAAVARINKSLVNAGQGVEFSIDQDSKRLVVKVVDTETHEVLRQMPSKEALEIAQGIDRAQGLLIKQEA